MRGFLLVALAASLTLATGAVAADGLPRKALTPTGQATARSVVLERGDLGAGFTAVAADENERLPKGARCGPLGEDDLTIIGDAASPDFRSSRAPFTIGSTAQVYRTLREANVSWSRGSTHETTTCLGDIIRLSSAPGEKIAVVSARKISFPAVSPKTAAYRIVVTVAAGGKRSVPVYLDVVMLQHGRIQSGLLFTSVGQPVPGAYRVAVTAVVAARMADAVRNAGGPRGPVA